MGAGFTGSLIGFIELDPEVTDLLKKYQSEIDELKVETDSLRNLFRIVRGLSKEKVDTDFLNMKKEIWNASHSLIEVCDNIQLLFEQDQKQRLQDRTTFVMITVNI